MIRTRIVLFAIAILWTPAAVWADHDEASVPALTAYFSEIWTTRDELPHNTINDIIQTEDGYLWFATWEGLARFNGREFRVYDRSRETGLADVGVNSLALNESGGLLVGGARGSVVTVNKQRWQAMNVEPTLVTAVMNDDLGRYWVGTQDGQLYKATAAGEIVEQAFVREPGTIFKIRHVPNLGLVVATSRGVFFLSDTERRSATSMAFFEELPGTSALRNLDIRDLCWSDAHGLYIASRQGLWLWRNERLQRVAADEIDAPLTRILLDHQGVIWLGTLDRGLIRKSPRGVEHLSVEDGLPNNRIVSLYQDRERSIWIGTNSGLMRLRDAPFVSYTRAQGLSDDFVRGVTPYSKGGLLVATSRGLNHIHEGRVTPYLADTLLADMSLLGVAEASDGALWFATYASGAWRYQNGEFRNYATELPSLDVRTVRPLSDGSVWFGTANGLARLQDGEVKSYREADGLADDFVMSMIQDARGVLWVGTGRGLTRIEHPTASEPTLETVDIRQFDDAMYVFGFYEDRATETLWMATDRGLLRNRLNSSSMTMLGRSAGMPFDKFFEVVSDQQGHFWLSSNRGVIRVSRHEAEAYQVGTNEQLTIELFGESDGMASAQANGGAGPAATALPDGSVWFATAMGVSSIQPERLAEFDAVVPPVVMESFLADGRAIDRFEPAVLPAGTTRLELQFAGLGFVMPQRIRYRTRLIGFDRDWVDRGTQNTAEYTNLPPGEYVFQVEANYPNSWYAGEQFELAFTIRPLVWQTWWFWGLVIIGVSGVIFLGYGWRLGELQRSEIRLKQQVAEKTSELERLAMSDELTGLPNRRAFDQRLRDEFERSSRYGAPLSLAILDIDFFKRINDEWSHEAGDKALIRLADVIRSEFRNVDHVARWGGEEFVLLFPETDLRDAVKLCERLRVRVEESNCDDIAPGLCMTVSLGVASSPGLANPEKLLSRADRALYQAKETGRNRVCRG
ncbi:MAG: diguanylate cyclase [Idiomarina sp.]|nr:diguanylate cyclase [Idiomarina sp.]